MSIFDFFFGRSQNENNIHRSVKLYHRAVRTRNLAMEPLETRDLLSVTTGLINDSAYAELRAQYPSFNLPEEQSNLNVMTVDCNLADLKSAIAQAKSSAKPDLILVKTSNSINTITYSSSSDQITINSNVIIIGWGTKELTLNANEQCRVITISDNVSSKLGNIIIANGNVKVSSNTNSVKAYGGGIYSTGNLSLTGCTISNNSVSSSNTSSSYNYTSNSYGGGIYSTGTLSLTNCIITSNVSSSFVASSRSNSYGGGIYSTGNATITNCIVSHNKSIASSIYGGGIYFTSRANIVNSTITNNSSYGIYVNNSSAIVNIYNSIVVQNSLSDIHKASGSINAYNTLSSYSSWTNSANNIRYDNNLPLFTSFSDYHLLNDSQAINKGNNSYAVDESGQPLTTDIDGNPRIVGSVVDLGAYEYSALAELSIPNYSIVANGTSVTVNISPVNNAALYAIEYSLNDDFTESVIIDAQAGGNTLENLQKSQTYYVRVKSIGNDDYSDSEFSEAVSITLTVPATPLTSLALSSIAPEVGTEIIASLIPTDATADYQWFSGETLIEGAMGSTFIVTEDQIGQTITCVATGTGDYTGMVSMTTAAVPVPVVALDVPADVALSVYNATVTASWSAVENASSYTLEYKPVDAENWTALPGLEDTTASFVGVSGTMYNVRVKAVGTGDYSDSPYTEINTDKPTGPVVAINANKVTVSWVDDSPAADSVRYRVAGTTRWTVKKLNAGITEMSFNATIGANYEIEVLLDQQENNVLQGSAIVLDQPRLTSIRNELKDDTFQVNVTNYAAKNLAANVKQAIVSVNGVMTTLKIADQQGETALANGGKVAFSNGLFTFSEMNSNTSYKVMISFSDGHSVSKTSTALTVKTLKAPYLPPVIVSANAVSDTSITVTWDTAYGKNSTTPAQKYTVQYSTDGAKWTNATTGATGNSYTIQRLKGGVEYQVRVLATKDTAFEASAPSGVLSAQTLTLPKTVLDRTSVKDDTFKLDVTNYATSNLVSAPMLNVKSDKFGEAAIAIQNGSGSATFDNGMVAAFENGVLTFTNVPSNTQQKIQVNFSDGVCTTAWTAALTVKTTIAPYNKPVITNAAAVNSTSVLVEWDAVTGKNSTVLAPSYTVQYTTDGTRWTNANTRVVGTSFTIPNLKPNTSYRVAVIANKDAQFNASQPSESWEVRTL